MRSQLRGRVVGREYGQPSWPKSWSTSAAATNRWSQAPSRQFARPTINPDRMKAGVWEYVTRWTGLYATGERGTWHLTIDPCWDGTIAAWCIVRESDTTQLARSDLEPLYTAAGTGRSRTTTRYSSDTVRSDYLLEVSDGAAVEPRHVTVGRRQHAWPETIASDVLAALADPLAPTLLPLQPRRDDPQDVDRSFPGEDQEILSYLVADVAVAGSEGRDSGRLTLSGPVGPVSAPYGATIVTVRYADRVVRLWVTDSTRIIIHRETRFRDGERNAVLIDSLVSVRPLRAL